MTLGLGALKGLGECRGGSVSKKCLTSCQKVVFENNNPEADLYREESRGKGGEKDAERKKKKRKETKTIS